MIIELCMGPKDGLIINNEVSTVVPIQHRVPSKYPSGYEAVYKSRSENPTEDGIYKFDFCGYEEPLKSGVLV